MEECKKINNTFEEDLKKLDNDNKEIEIEKEKNLQKIMINNIEQKNKYEEQKENIENEHIIDMKNKEIELNKKIQDSKTKSKIDKDNHNLSIDKEQKKTEIEEEKLNQDLLFNENQIENDKKVALLNIDINKEEQLMMQEIESNKDDMLLQMLTAQMMGNACNQAHQN